MPYHVDNPEVHLVESGVGVGNLKEERFIVSITDTNEDLIVLYQDD